MWLRKEMEELVVEEEMEEVVEEGDGGGGGIGGDGEGKQFDRSKPLCFQALLVEKNRV